MEDLADIKAKARRSWEEILPACDVSGLEEVVDPDIVSHGSRPEEPPGIEGMKRTMFWLARVFSDQRWEIHHVIGDGDMVALHATHHARHTGELMGIPPTNRQVAYNYVHILRFRDGKAVEHWSVRDDMTLLRQLGALPERPGQPVAAQAARRAIGSGLGRNDHGRPPTLDPERAGAVGRDLVEQRAAGPSTARSPHVVQLGRRVDQGVQQAPRAEGAQPATRPPR
jgi:predicted ester cyclase